MIERVDGPAFWKAGALGFLAFTTLDIGAKTTCPCGDFLTGERILAKRFRFVRRRSFTVGIAAELARILALWIVGATDECAIFAELQRERAGAASRAGARIAAVFARREYQWRQLFVQCVEDIGDAQFLDIIDRTGEIAPEIAQHIFP